VPSPIGATGVPPAHIGSAQRIGLGELGSLLGSGEDWAPHLAYHRRLVIFADAEEGGLVTGITRFPMGHRLKERRACIRACAANLVNETPS